MNIVEQQLREKIQRQAKEIRRLHKAKKKEVLRRAALTDKVLELDAKYRACVKAVQEINEIHGTEYRVKWRNMIRQQPRKQS